MNRMFDPGPRTYTHLIDRLNRRNDLKYRDYSTALDFTLQATMPVAGDQEQEALFEVQPLVKQPQEETLFSPEPPA